MIGHSHGGNIAFKACDIAQKDNAYAIAMSTPFIVTSPRYAGATNSYVSDADSVGLVIGVFVACFMLLLNYLPLTEDVTTAARLLFLVLVFFIYIFFSTPTKKFITNIIVELKERIKKFSSSNNINFLPQNSLILRIAGDEASGLLSLSHLSIWIIRSAYKLIGFIIKEIRDIEDYTSAMFKDSFFKRVAVVLTILYLAFAIDQAIGIFVFYILILSWARLVSIAIEMLLFLFSFPVVFVLSLPFGFELAIRSSFLSISVESNPVGVWSTKLMPNNDSFLSHSEIYYRDEIFEEIAKFHKSQTKKT